MRPSALCPNPDCRAPLSSSRDVTVFTLTPTEVGRVFAIACSKCGVLIGTATQQQDR
jgi:hypothetical protein